MSSSSSSNNSRSSNNSSSSSEEYAFNIDLTGDTINNYNVIIE